MFTAAQLVAHAVGDYVLQSDWMATEKTKRLGPAVAHGLVYALPFLLITRSWLALAVIVGTHAAIDRWRLARFVVYAKNFLAPETTPREADPPTRWWHHWEECSATGYHKDRPVWLAVWLLIIADNVLHVCINAAAIAWLGRL